MIAYNDRSYLRVPNYLDSHSEDPLSEIFQKYCGFMYIKCVDF